jgi:hypothetical protein
MRYALGRQTYMPSLVQDLVKDHHEVLTADDFDQLAREIDEYHGRVGSIGADFDTRDWLRFAEWLRERRDALLKNGESATPVPVGDPPASNLTETVREFADTPDTNDCVKFYRSSDPEYPVMCVINGAGSMGKSAEDALRRAREVWDQIRSESVSATNS